MNTQKWRIPNRRGVIQILTVALLTSSGLAVLGAEELNQALRKAVEKRRISEIAALIDKGTDIHQADRKGRSALSIAKDKGAGEIVALLERLVKQREAKLAEAAWEGLQKEPSYEGYNRFLLRFPRTPYVAEMDRAVTTKFLRQTALRLAGGEPQKIVLARGFLVIPGIAGPTQRRDRIVLNSSDSEVHLVQNEKGEVFAVKGAVPLGNDGIWMSGTTHVLLGKVTLGRPSVDFYSDFNRPLTFWVDLLGGYVYQQGGVGVIHVRPGRGDQGVKDYPYDPQNGTVYAIGLEF